jgi:hypothetical protein
MLSEVIFILSSLYSISLHFEHCALGVQHKNDFFNMKTLKKRARIYLLRYLSEM